MTHVRVAVDDVSVRLGGADILDGVDAAVGEGRFIGLVGPNGAGKTTLLRTIDGRIAPDDGEVFLDGTLVADLTARQIGRRAAIVPQETVLPFDFRVRDVVEMGRYPYRSWFGGPDPGRDRVEWALDHTGTAELAGRRVRSLSGGERGRVLIARALAQDTPVLLLDEPTASLDVRHAIGVLDLVRGLVDDRGKTVIAAIHDLDLAARYCDEIILLAEGRVRAAGLPESVLTGDNLREAFDVRAVVGRDPVTGSVTVTALPEPAPDLTDRVHVVAGGGAGARLLYLLSAAGFSVSVGPLVGGDPDLEAARALGLDAAVVPPFTPVNAAVTEATRLARRADVTVLADIDVGPGNAASLEVATAADRLVVVEERPFDERNHAGPDAAERYRRLSGWGRRVRAAEAVSAVVEAISEGRSARVEADSR